MNILARLRKILSVSLITLSFLLNVSVIVVIAFIWRIVVNFKQMNDLLKTGTSTSATVVRIEERVVYLANFSKPKQKITRTMYRLVASWQHPQTGKMYTFKAPITHPEKFPVGSSVDFIVNYDNPRIHRLADIMGVYTPIDRDSSPMQDA